MCSKTEVKKLKTNKDLKPCFVLLTLGKESMLVPLQLQSVLLGLTKSAIGLGALF